MFAAIPALTVALCLVVVWPPAQSAFHEPKRWVLVVGAALALGAVRRAGWRQWAAVPLVVMTVLSPWAHVEAGVQALAFAVALVTWPRVRPTLAGSARMLMWPAAIVSVVVLLQALGVDPLHAVAEGSRLRLYGTLGNPDFVASALLPVGWIVSSSPPVSLFPAGERVGVRGRTLCGLLVLGALIATRSFATVGAAVVSSGVFLLVSPLPDPLPRRGEGVVVVIICALLAVPLLNRDLRNSLSGRAYLVSVVAPHLTERPLIGHGLGSTVDAWPAWELELWQSRCADASCVAAHPQSRFTGLQDHVHSDFVEIFLERGVLGLLALVVALAVPVMNVIRRRDSDARWIAAALTAALVRALFDFPLHRPADLAVLALLCAMASLPSPRPSPPRGEGAQGSAPQPR